MLLTAMEYLRNEDALRNFCGSQKKSEKVENDIDFETSQQGMVEKIENSG